MVTGALQFHIVLEMLYSTGGGLCSQCSKCARSDMLDGEAYFLRRESIIV